MSHQREIYLPEALYYSLKREAQRQGVQLPSFVRKRVKLKPASKNELANLPLKELLKQTAPAEGVGDRLDFFG